ncbi:MAG TPA: SRPBCC family protein [Mycobacteriales bacterium]|jgi:uncharacterized protein YndB with AHSA1/START domain|nr:SRPBCC family protein [Mycobacteriales bacterium]
MDPSSETKDSASVERVIPATPEAIFALIADPSRHHEIDGSGTVRDAKDMPATLELGAKFGMSMKLGVRYSTVSTVIEYEPGRRLAWQTYPTVGGRLAGGRIWRYELEQVEGGTRVRETWDISQERVKAIVRPARARSIESMTKTLERIEQILA